MSHDSDSEAVEQVLASLSTESDTALLSTSHDQVPERDEVEELLKRLEAESFSGSQDYTDTVSMAVDDDPEITINLKPKHISHTKPTSTQSTPNIKARSSTPPKSYSSMETDSTENNAITVSVSEEPQTSKPSSSSSSIPRTPLKDLNNIIAEPAPPTPNGKHQPTLTREPSTTDTKSTATTTSSTTSRKSPSPPKEQPPKPWKLKSQPKLQTTDDIVFVAAPPSITEKPLLESKQNEALPVVATPVKVEPPAATKTAEERVIAPNSPAIVNNKPTTALSDIHIDTDNANLVESIRQEVTRQLAQEIGVLEMEFSELKQKYDREVRGNISLKSALYEYEQTIKKLIEGAGAAAKDEALAERAATLEAENRRKASEAEATQIAFNDLKTRYEEMKLLNEKLKTNEQILKETIQRQNTDLAAQESRFDKLKMHAETKLDSASERLAQVKSDAAREVALVTAKLQKAEGRVAQLEEQLQASEDKNRELLSICDDLLARLDKKWYVISHSLAFLHTPVTVGFGVL